MSRAHRGPVAAKPTSRLLALLALLMAGCLHEPVQPNILLIVADDLSFDRYGYAGHPTIQTPNIDQLASQSIHFDSGYVPSSCRPTLATLLTGLPQRTHLQTFAKSHDLEEVTTIADRLRAAGYVTYQAGKFWDGHPKIRGFDDWSAFTALHGDLDIGRTGIDPILDFIAGVEQPWFVWFTPLMPHSPHDPPASFKELYADQGLDRAVLNYWAMISWFDDVVGDLLSSIPPDTVVIYLSDNGFVQSEQAWVFAERSKTSAYEHGVRTPVMFRHPVWEPERREEPIHAVDVVATLAAIAGADRSGLPGVDVLYEELPLAIVDSTWEPITKRELWARWVGSGS
jgi:arylsulfatase A-like enzyme